jgi:hypothetical protein
VVVIKADHFSWLVYSHSQTVLPASDRKGRIQGESTT